MKELLVIEERERRLHKWSTSSFENLTVLSAVVGGVPKRWSGEAKPFPEIYKAPNQRAYHVWPSTCHKCEKICCNGHTTVFFYDACQFEQTTIAEDSSWKCGESPSITQWRCSPLRTLANTSSIKGKRRRPNNRPRTSSRSLLKPIRKS